jgi:hypothetical protein
MGAGAAAHCPLLAAQQAQHAAGACCVLWVWLWWDGTALGPDGASVAPGQQLVPMLCECHRYCGVDATLSTCSV